MKATGHTRQAFTPIELMVVLAIIGVTLLLLLAAVQKVREAANRSACANNLRQIALAAHHYDAQWGALPPNFAEDLSRTDGSHNLLYGPVVRLLPFLELDQTYRNFSFLYYDSPFPDPQSLGWPPVAGGMDWVHHSYLRNPFNRPPSTTAGYAPPPDPLSCPNPTGATGVSGQMWGSEGNFRVFECRSQPFDHAVVQQGTALTGSYAGIPTIDFPRGNPFADPVAGQPNCFDTNTNPNGPACIVNVVSYAPGGYVIGRSDYVAVAGAFIDSANTSGAFVQTPAFAQKYQGLFNYHVNASMSRVPDGTSNTLLFSEFAGKIYQNSPDVPQLNGWTSASWSTSGISAVFGSCPNENNSNCDSAGNQAIRGGFTLGGWHAGVFNVAFADGSVRPLTVSIDPGFLLSLAGYRDGDVIPADF